MSDKNKIEKMIKCVGDRIKNLKKIQEELQKMLFQLNEVNQLLKFYRINTDLIVRAEFKYYVLNAPCLDVGVFEEIKFMPAGVKEVNQKNLDDYELNLVIEFLKFKNYFID